jgi:hypothetical protein
MPSPCRDADRFRDRAAHARLVAADELRAAVDDRLRRIQAVRTEDPRVGLLPIG